jgi:integrase
VRGVWTGSTTCRDFGRKADVAGPFDPQETPGVGPPFGRWVLQEGLQLVALDVEDVEEVPAGLRVTIRRSKTDQEGLGAVIALPCGAVACPVAAFKAWIRGAGITAGPVFRPVAKGERLQNARLTDRSVAKIVKAHAVRVGLDPAAFAGHSLRSGFLTSAATRGASIFKMADQSRHRSMDTLRGYVRDAEIFKDHAGAGLL